MAGLYVDFGSANSGKRKPTASTEAPTAGKKEKTDSPSPFGSFVARTATTLAQPSSAATSQARQYPSSLMDPGFGSADSPGTEDTIPTLLDQDLSAGNQDSDTKRAKNPKQPADPLGNKLTPKEVYDKLPENIRETVEQIKAAGVGNSEQTGKLKFHLNTLMHEGKNPFPVIRLYKEYIGSEQLGRVLNAGMVKKLDYFWENWELQKPDPQADKAKEETAKKGPNWLRLERLGPSRDAPKVIKEDPLSYLPKDINGVERDPESGRFVASAGTVKWIRTIAFSIYKSGKKEELYEPFLDLMRGYFGDEAVQKAMNPALDTSNGPPPPATTVQPQEKKDESQSAESNEEADELRWLMNNMTVRHIPGISGEVSRAGFSVETSTWIQRKTERILAVCLNPDPFLRKLADLYGEAPLRGVFTQEIARTFAAGIRNLPSSVPEPVFLTKIVKGGGAGGSDVPRPVTNRPVVGTGYGRPVYEDYRQVREAPDRSYGIGGGHGRGHDGYGRRMEVDSYDYYDRTGALHEHDRFRDEREKYEEYRARYEEESMAERYPREPPRPLMPPPGSSRPMTGHPNTFLGVHMRMDHPQQQRYEDSRW